MPCFPDSASAGAQTILMRSASSGLRHPASASCLGRHLRLAGRCPNNSSLFPPLAAVVVVAGHNQRKDYFKFRGSETPAGVSEPHFHGWGRRGKRQMQRRFLRKRSAAGKRARPLRQFASLTATSPKGRGLGMAGKFAAKPQSLRACPLPRGELSRSD